MLKSDDFNKDEYVMVTGARNPNAVVSGLLLGLPLKIKAIQRPFLVVEPVAPIAPVNVLQIDTRVFVFDKCKTEYVSALQGREKIGV